MNNERGFTLAEVLAALTIAMVVLGVCSLLLASIDRMTHTSTQRHLDRASMNRTMNTIADRMNAAVRANYIEAANELRFTDGARAWALSFDAAVGTLTLYEFDAGASLAQFADDGVTYGTHSERYSRGIVLSDIVGDIRYTGIDGSPLPGAAVLSGGDFIKIEAAFRYGAASPPSARTVEHRASAVIKLMEDQTTK